MGLNPVSKVASDDQCFWNYTISKFLLEKVEATSGDMTAGSILLEPVLLSRSYVPYRWPDSYFQYLVQIHIAIHWTIEPHHWKATPVDNAHHSHYFFTACFIAFNHFMLVPSIGHFANVEAILTLTIFRPSISLFQTKTLETSTKTHMQTSWHFGKVHLVINRWQCSVRCVKCLDRFYHNKNIKTLRAE